MDIMDFSGKLENLIDRAEASYIELIGTLELAKQRLIQEALVDEEDEEDDLEEYEDGVEYEDDEDDGEEDDEDDDRFR